MAQWADALSDQRASIDAGVLRFQPGQTRELSSRRLRFYWNGAIPLAYATARHDQDRTSKVDV